MKKCDSVTLFEKKMIPTGIEPVSAVPETAILSIELRDLYR